MAAHEITFHLWKAGFNRNPLQGEKYEFNSALLQFCTPLATGGMGGRVVGGVGMPKPRGNLLQVLQLAQGYSL